MWVGGTAWLQPDMRGHVSAPKAGEISASNQTARRGFTPKSLGRLLPHGTANASQSPAVPHFTHINLFLRPHFL